MNQYCQMLSNSLLRLADCSRRVSLRFRSEVLDPLKTFNENYENIYDDIKRKINEKVESVISLTQEHSKLKDNFNQAYEKLEKHKEIQKKVIEKIESGNKN
jgi:regulator of replication initiation timing